MCKILSNTNNFKTEQFDSLIGYQQVLSLQVRVDHLWLITIKEYSTVPRPAEMEPHHHMLFSGIFRTSLCGRSYLSAGDPYNKVLLPYQLDVKKTKHDKDVVTKTTTNVNCWDWYQSMEADKEHFQWFVFNLFCLDKLAISYWITLITRL